MTLYNGWVEPREQVDDRMKRMRSVGKGLCPHTDFRDWSVLQGIPTCDICGAQDIAEGVDHEQA